MKVCDIIIDFLLKHDIHTVFGIIGSANSHIYDALYRNGFNVINVHHEQTAVMAAGAYYRTCGCIAIALVTAGAGATNSVTGIVSLWADSIPSIIISGQESSKYVNEYRHRRMYGTQGVNIVHMVSDVTKFSKLTNSETIQDDLEIAYKECLSGRPGPVLIDVPFDVQSQDISIRPWRDDVMSENVRVKSDDMDLIHSLLKESNRPVLLAGHGIKLSGSKDIFNNKCVNNIPILLTWSSIDLMSHDNELYFGIPGIYGQRAANHILQRCDLLIVIGSRLALPQTGYNTDNYAKNAKIVMVDIDKTENKNFVDYYIHSDCKQFINEFITEGSWSDWIEECKQIKYKYPIIEKCHDDQDKLPNSYKIIRVISDHLEKDTVIVTDMGTALLSGHQAIKLGSTHTMFTSYGLGEMGFGLPAAIGAAVSKPDSTVLCLNCDGSMMMNLQELQTIKQHNMNVKIVIFNNDGYLMIKHTQKMLFDGKYSAVNSKTGVILPDYIKIGNAFGYNTFRITSWDDFNSLFPVFIDNPCASICEILMEPEQDFVPKLKGVVKNGVLTPPNFDEMSPLIDE